MIPLFFGRPERQLYGVYHPAPEQGRSARAMLFCNPFGQEAIRVNRPYRVLADKLTRQRWHVLRFDYSSSGDSAGSDADARVEAWLGDIATAIQELRAMAGVKSVHLLGIRVGATLAALSAAGRRDVEGLVLWEPIVSGRRYLESLLPTWRPEHPGDVAGETHGFVVPSALARGFCALALDAASIRGDGRVLLVGDGSDADQAALRQRLERSVGDFTFREVHGPLPWTKANDYGAGPLPVEALNAIVEWRGAA